MKKSAFKKHTELPYIITIALFLSLILNIFLFLKVFKTPDINILELYQLPISLINYRNPEFVDTSVPNRSPFGGEGYNYTRITANYLSMSYKSEFGQDHYGIDIVPTQDYYKNQPVFLSLGRALVYSTLNGEVEYLSDEFGANYLVITNPQKTIRAMYVHLEASYVNTGDIVRAGEIIGVMGSTGHAIGKHVHYAIQIKNQNGYWTYANPNNYIVTKQQTIPGF
ncbi:hypothetical protein COV24_00775 [candidate division WWE3 bacterium CG10_big_fil_rev_8_21_14_0_10_32_10]|uniref:M23ase beta-sheet core domain-containing protein n=1 Tax=candidate division WWE3 bacterium CG10_big_fil_rev_8_21_14_0_10_32_10 TaxID=1975090 RepID=A0A2H0RB65_UNCKA|nr:MAG: hypothetical protein COV24_00775 [candidate division WWE3 bacterium CG10_big_fil_rev_8_21_14_0_10_32_10]